MDQHALDHLYSEMDDDLQGCKSFMFMKGMPFFQLYTVPSYALYYINVLEFIRPCKERHSYLIT